MRGRKLKLGLPDVAAVIDGRHAKERDARNKNRLLSIKLVARGEHASAQIGPVRNWETKTGKGVAGKKVLA